MSCRHVFAATAMLAASCASLALAQSTLPAAFTSGGTVQPSGTILVIGQPFAASTPQGTFGIVPLLTGAAPPCPLDLSGNDTVDADDIFAFLALWFDAPPGASCITPPTGCPGDWNNDGTITADDIFAYLADWFAFGPGSACP